MNDNLVTREEMEQICSLQHKPLDAFMVRTESHFREVFDRLNRASNALIGLLLAILISLAVWIITERNSAPKEQPVININIDKSFIEEIRKGRDN